jgi:hypothetical protein
MHGADESGLLGRVRESNQPRHVRRVVHRVHRARQRAGDLRGHDADVRFQLRRAVSHVRVVLPA